MQRKAGKQPGLITRLLQTFTVLSGLITWSILFYPLVSDAWNRHVLSGLITAYEADAGAQTDYSRECEAAQGYNEALYAGAVLNRKDYEAQMSGLEDQMMGYVQIPAIDVSIPIYHDTSEEVLSKGIGHLYGSSLPVGGPNTHAVLVGHSGLVHARLFSDLEKMKQGDFFYLFTLGRKLIYQVDQIKVVLPEEAEDLAIENGKDYCTLLTCTPYGINTHRLLVRGERVVAEENNMAVSSGRPLFSQASEGDSAVQQSAALSWVQKCSRSLEILLGMYGLLLLFGGILIVKIWWRYGE